MTITHPRLLRLVAILAIIAGVFMPTASARAATPVTVDNSTALAAAIAKALDVGAPFEANINCKVYFFANACQAAFTAPTKQRLVIEYVSFSCPITTYTVPVFGQFIISSTGTGVAGYNALTLPQNAGHGFAQLGQTVKIYVDPGSEIAVTTFLKAGYFSFSGSAPFPSPVPGTPCNVTLNGRQIPD